MKNLLLSTLIVLLFSSLSFSQLSSSEFQIAVKMNTYGDAQLFLDHVTALQKKYPNDSKVVFLYGAYQYKIGNTEHAKKTFSKSIDMDSTFPYPYVARATIFAQKQDYDNAIADMSSAIYWDSKNIQAREIRADYCIQIKRYDLALEDIDAKIKLEPNNLNNYTKAVSLCLLQDQVQKAETYFAKAYACKNISSTLVAIQYARHLSSLQRFFDVVTRYQEAIAGDPTKLVAIDFSDLSTAYMKANDFVRALFYATKAEKLEPINLVVKCNTANIYMAKSDWKKAKKYAQRVLEIDPKNKQGNSIMSIVEMKLGNVLSSKIFAVRAEN